jgi:hypothetical protein
MGSSRSIPRQPPTDRNMTQSRLERWAGIIAGLLAPLGLITALLFYFGYRSTQAQYAYFGIDVNTVGMSTADFVMRSPQPLLIPLVALAVIAIPILVIHTFLRRSVIHSCRPSRTVVRSRTILFRLFVGVAIFGGIALLLSVAITFAYPFLRDLFSASLVASVGYLAGAALALYGGYMASLVRSGNPSGRAVWHRLGGPQHAVVVLLLLVLVGSSFWATSILAGLIGRGAAGVLATQFQDLPSVILDTKERLYLRHPSVLETALPNEPGQLFRYRYRHLRLLVDGADRMFLVPEQWTNGGTSIVVPLDESVRVQFLFQNPG